MPDDAITSRMWWILAAMGAILGVILLDETVVGVALPTIQTDLAMTEVGSHWVVNIYMLALAALAAAAGKFGDMVGHRALMIAGLLVFGLASLACGFSQTGTWLIVARGIQGVGAAIIFPSSLAMITIIFPESRRGLALGVYGAIGTTFLALGPFVGGLLTDLASWRWIFWINPPIVLAVALVVLVKWNIDHAAPVRQRFDRAGFLALVLGLSALVFGIMQGPDWGWPSPAILGALVAGVLLLVGFVAIELKRRSAALIEVALFRNPTFSACNLVIFLAQYSKMAVFVFGALYLQDALKLSALEAGLALLPTVAPQIVTAPLAGRITDRDGERWPSIAGVATILAGLVWIGLAVSADNYAILFPGLLLWGLSMAFLFLPPQRAVMSSVPPGQQGQAGGIAMSAQLLGAAIGMAISSTLYNTTGSYAVVFLSNAALAAVVLVVALLAIERTGPKPAAAG
ncbi:MAG: MFS transporter [Bauldia sp.]|uniref:MFS transporter n=1 Tax=Bauldia sp. TaxID=2575872 RepID=UPI001DC73A91|nr:MFS transporter [Bauldia sp.]MCB1494302.1 MFS transporter [Bauldia sp.]